MDNISLLGTSFEISLRLLILLDVMSGKKLDEQQICCIDFIAVYASDFGLADENLHGYGAYRFSEFPARRQLVSVALKSLALNGYINLNARSDGFSYTISTEGQKMARLLLNAYAREYRLFVSMVKKHYSDLDSSKMIDDINYHIEYSVREDHYDE